MEAGSNIGMCQPSYSTMQNDFLSISMHGEYISGKTVNFTFAEKRYLVNLINKRREVLIDTKAFGLSKQHKQDAWGELAVEFNSNLLKGNPYRNPKQLRKCWENMKTRFRKLNPDCVDPLAEILRENEQQGLMEETKQLSPNTYKIKTSDEFPNLTDVEYHGPASMVVTSLSPSHPTTSTIQPDQTMPIFHNSEAPTADEIQMSYNRHNFEPEVKSDEVIHITDDVMDNVKGPRDFAESFKPVSSTSLATGLKLNGNIARSRGNRNTFVDRNQTRPRNLLRKSNTGIKIGSISNRLLGRLNSNYSLAQTRANVSHENTLRAKLTRMRIREADARVQLLKQRMRNESEKHEAMLLLLRKKSAFYEAQANSLRDGIQNEEDLSSSDEIEEL